MVTPRLPPPLLRPHPSQSCLLHQAPLTRAQAHHQASLMFLPPTQPRCRVLPILLPLAPSPLTRPPLMSQQRAPARPLSHRSLQLQQPHQMMVGFSAQLLVFSEMLPVPSCRTPVLIHLPLHHLRKTLFPPLLMGLLHILPCRHLSCLHLLVQAMAEAFLVPSPV